ncbi:MAG: replicative DNA helicase [Candidatus Methanofastidiosum methylothiophilum]|uniref:Replicative DNA helicase n=1 Tax=Candidatus Methanofastidiosum methylothiophilum TaxID=1705564 RepID=A0A150IUZ8_9EURY|nr:MAG: replicative DNA helicase [Candidatus Methanofastidiosum methylthiophilus]
MNTEEILLATQLNYPEVLSIIEVPTYVYSSTIYQTIAGAIKELVNNGGVLSENLLISHLETKGKLKDVNESVITYLFGLDCDRANYKIYAEQVILDFQKRLLLSKLSEAKEALKNGNNVSETISNLENLLSKLSNVSVTQDTELLSSFVSVGIKELENKINNPGITGLHLGIEDLDLVTNGIIPSHLWVIGGRPGMGKTQLLCNIALKTENPVLVFELEMNKQAIFERFLGIETGIDTLLISRGFIDKPMGDKIKDAIEVFKQKKIILDTNASATIEYIENVTREMVRKHGVKIVLIDYLQLMTERDEGQTHELGRITRRLKILAKSLNIGIILLSQLNRGVETRDDKRPMLSDLRQSGNIEEDADLIIFLYRDAYYNKEAKNDILELIIAKNRHGKSGIYPLKYEESCGRISNFDKKGYKFDD